MADYAQNVWLMEVRWRSKHGNELRAEQQDFALPSCSVVVTTTVGHKKKEMTELQVVPVRNQY